MKSIIGMKSIIRILAAVAASLAASAAFALNPPSANIYGIHGWASNADMLLNGKGAYVTDMTYADWWDTDVGRKAGFISMVQDAHNRGFTVIARIDYKPCEVVPPTNDMAARLRFGEICKDMANTLKDYCQIWVIGNEMQAGYCTYQPPKDWYTKVIGYDADGVYDKIHSVQPNAIVCCGAMGGWPGSVESEPNCDANYLDYFCKNIGNRIDGFAVHSYNGPANNAIGGALDDPRTSDMGSFGAYKAYCDVIYRNFQHTKKVYITEWNTYWWVAHASPNSEDSYETGTIQKAYEAIDQWNRSSDLKISAMCWYAWAHYGLCPPTDWVGDWYYNAIQPGRCTPAPRLDQARADFLNATATTNYRSDVNTTNGRLQIEAENYDNSQIWGDTAGTGIEGTDFHDTDGGNNGGAYRPDDVDISATSTGYNVGWGAAGEWLKYTLRGGKALGYRAEIRFARDWPGSTCQVRLTVDNVTVATFALPHTGGWETWQTATASSGFTMTNGVHSVKLCYDGDGANIDWFAFTPYSADAKPGWELYE